MLLKKVNSAFSTAASKAPRLEAERIATSILPEASPNTATRASKDLRPSRTPFSEEEKDEEAASEATGVEDAVVGNFSPRYSLAREGLPAQGQTASLARETRLEEQQRSRNGAIPAPVQDPLRFFP